MDEDLLRNRISLDLKNLLSSGTRNFWGGKPTKVVRYMILMSVVHGFKFRTHFGGGKSTGFGVI